MSFQLRALDTLRQRVDCLKIYILSKLVFKAQALPLPGVYAAQFERIIFRFLWRGKLEKLALQEIYNPPEEGGLGMVAVRTKADSCLDSNSPAGSWMRKGGGGGGGSM